MFIKLCGLYPYYNTRIPIHRLREERQCCHASGESCGFCGIYHERTIRWAKNDIDFVVARGLLSGTSNTTFAPETSMTRGMFVTALGRLAGVDTKKYSTTKFSDVKADAYYAPYVAWANANNIVNGTSDTTFSPDKAISRQEMAIMLVNYSKTIGYKLPSVHAQVTFTDASSIASWAKDAAPMLKLPNEMNCTLSPYCQKNGL